MEPTGNTQRPSHDVVLAKAVLRASVQLGLKPANLAKVIGVHRTTIYRLKQKTSLDPKSKQGELAALLIRVASALSTLMGEDEVWIQRFMHSPNGMTNGVPAKQMESVQGLDAVFRYADGMKNR